MIIIGATKDTKWHKDRSYGGLNVGFAGGKIRAARGTKYDIEADAWDRYVLFEANLRCRRQEPLIKKKKR